MDLWMSPPLTKGGTLTLKNYTVINSLKFYSLVLQAMKKETNYFTLKVPLGVGV
jgi:hypothetical protein